jgi:hypothetical protein
VIFNEIMVDPEAVLDSSGEWIELKNVSEKAVQLYGLTLAGDGGEAFPIAVSKVLEPGGLFVLARKAAPEDNGGVTPDLLYSKVPLVNGGDTLILRRGVILVDKVVFGAGWPLVEGASLSLDPLVADFELNDDPAAWCASSSAMSGGDKGTPGAENDPCP